MRHANIVTTCETNKLARTSSVLVSCFIPISLRFNCARPLYGSELISTHLLIRWVRHCVTIQTKRPRSNTAITRTATETLRSAV